MIMIQLEIYFGQKTGEDLNKLVEVLNRSPNRIIKTFFGKLYTKKFYNKKAGILDNYINKVNSNIRMPKSNNRDFIPKHTIDYESINSRNNEVTIPPTNIKVEEFQK